MLFFVVCLLISVADDRENVFSVILRMFSLCCVFCFYGLTIASILSRVLRLNYWRGSDIIYFWDIMRDG